MGGRPMKGWFVVPPKVVQDDAALTALFDATLAAVVKLPAKGEKPAKKAPAKAAKAKPAAKASAKKKSR
jgi:hypothetical protein